MKIRTLIKYGFVALALCFALSGFVFAFFVVNEADSNFRTSGFDYLYRDRLFTGVLYRPNKDYSLGMIAFFWNGRRTGTERFWYDNGAAFSVQPYKDGLPHGDWKQWYPNGKVKSFRHYEHGKIDGESWGWHENGQVSDFNVNVQGKEVTHKSWISDGTPFYNYVAFAGERIGMRGGEFCKRLSVIGN